MNPYQKLQYKTRVGILLALLLSGLLINNIIGYESYDRMEATANSMYADRLMPSTYIFEITEHLHRGHVLWQSGQAGHIAGKGMDEHQLAIRDLIARYEQTALTREERSQWTAFKTNLADLYSRSGSAAAPQAFEKTLQCLNALNIIQAKEGRQLQANVRSIVGTSSLRSHLETVLLLVIGGCTLQLIGASRNIFQQSWPHKASMN